MLPMNEIKIERVLHIKNAICWKWKSCLIMDMVSQLIYVNYIDDLINWSSDPTFMDFTHLFGNRGSYHYSKNNNKKNLKKEKHYICF